MRGGGAEDDAVLAGDAEQPVARVLLAGEELRPVLAAPGADLDLGLDQLTRHRVDQHRVGVGKYAQLAVALRQAERVRIQKLELLLHGQREVR